MIHDKQHTLTPTKRAVLVIALLLGASSLLAFFYADVRALAGTLINRTLATNPDLEDGLVGHWTFDGQDMDNGVEDRSGNGNTGVINGQTSTTTAPGTIGQALEFDGSDDYVDVGSDTALNLTSDLTIAAWVKPTDNGASDYGIVARGGGNWTYVFALNDSSGSWRPGLYTDGPWNYGSSVYGYDQWRHVVVTITSGGSLTFYVDGVADGTATETGVSNPSSSTLIGDWEGGSSSNFNGQIDDVRIYNRALSADEIERLYELGATTKVNTTISTNPDLENGLVGHWTFDGNDLSRSTVSDRSGNGNNGNELNDIDLAYATGNLTFIADQWGGSANDGEFDITCTGGDASCEFRTTAGEVPSMDISNGVACSDGATYSGYLMYSEESVHTRFSASPPHADNSDNFICVRYNSGWEYDNNTSLVSFTPVDSDILVAEINTSADTVSALTHAPTLASGRLGQALDFDGSDDHVNVGDAQIIGADTSFSISTWIKGDRWDEKLQNAIYVEQNDAGDDVRNYLEIDGTQEIAGTGKVIFDQFPPSGGSLASDTVLATGRWYHVVYTQNSSDRSMYIDGALDSSDSSAETYTGTTPDDVLIGGVTAFADDRYFDGQLDDFRIYDRTLSVSEVERLYQIGATTHINTTINTNPDLENGLVGYWTFDGKDMDWDATDEALDRSGNGNAGNVTNFDQEGVRVGKIGQALEFDGSGDYINIGDQSSLELGGVITVSAWMRNDDGDTSEREIASKGGNTGSWEFAFIKWDDDDILFTITQCDGNSYLTGITSAQGLNDGEWHHVVGTGDGSRLDIYVDGVLRASDTTTAGSACTGGTDPFRIGFATFGNREDYLGQLDDVRIYNRALSADEIKRLYELGK